MTDGTAREVSLIDRLGQALDRAEAAAAGLRAERDSAERRAAAFARAGDAALTSLDALLATG